MIVSKSSLIAIKCTSVRVKSPAAYVRVHLVQRAVNFCIVNAGGADATRVPADFANPNTQ